MRPHWGLKVAQRRVALHVKMKPSSGVFDLINSLLSTVVMRP